MSDTPTPETDAAQFGTGRVSVDFARRLERERDEARDELANEQKRSDCVSGWYEDEVEAHAKTRTEVARLREDLCRWRLAWEQASLERRQWRECANMLAFAAREALRDGKTILNWRAFAQDGLSDFDRLKGQAQ